MCADLTEIGEDGSPPAGAADAAGAEGGAEAPWNAGQQRQQGLQAGSSRKDNPSLHNLPHSLQKIPPISMI